MSDPARSRLKRIIRLMKLRRIVLLLVLPLLLTGCQYLFPGFYSYPSDPEFPLPSFAPAVQYTTGAATVDFTQGTDKQTIQLGELAGSYEMGSLNAVWRNDDGWSLTLSWYDTFGAPIDPMSGTVTISRIHDNQLWTSDSFMGVGNCRVTIAARTQDQLSGTATCHDLRWMDGLSGPGGLTMPGPGSSYIEGEDPFDIDVTFEGRPR
jgi:hypothetical protein